MMPFITEEIWQRLKEPLGLEGESIMVQPYPVAGNEAVDAEADVEWLKNVIQGVRRVRSELNLPPGKMLGIWLQSGSDLDRSRFESLKDVLFHLGRIESSRWVDDDADSSQSAVALVGDLKILIPLKGLVDVEEELARLQKLLSREQNDLKKSEGKLGNKRFVENAPEAVVEQERLRLEAHKANTENLHQQIRLMEAMRS